MLTQPEYGLYVVYESGTEHKLAVDEKPLLAQLEWVKSNADGRFLLRDENAPREKLEVSSASMWYFCFENACQMSTSYHRPHMITCSSSQKHLHTLPMTNAKRSTDKTFSCIVD